MDSLDFLGLLAPPSTTPAPPVLDPARPVAPVTQTAPAQPRWRSRYGVAYCTICDMAAQYCKGHALISPELDSDLSRRIAEVVSKRAGR